jgi:cellulose synthase/poly-beta-1,6-N-acetylglucosamine synthase-like glycosyltransferase
MSAVELIFLGAYFAILVCLSFYGSHRYQMAWLYYRHKATPPVPPPEAATMPLPRVTIQLPLYNERYVVQRLVEHVCRIDYPRDRLEIQVLDDSTDDTQALARQVVDRFHAQGFDIVHLHRSDRTGFKAGALQAGMAVARGEFIAVFDADFLPPVDFLRRTVPFFADTGIGMVQARWDHINRDYSLLTHAQSILLDGHFMIEHTARNRSGRFFNFNGTAGIWRRQAILDAGGWEHDTLTEDLDLSYRAQLAGWRFVFLNDLLSPAEIPVEMNAFKTQQHRWAKGSIQVALKLLPRILRSDLPFAVRSEAFIHLTSNIAYVMMVIMALMMPLTLHVRVDHGWTQTLLLDLPFFLGATVSVCYFYMLSQRETGQTWQYRMRYLPLVLALGIGLALNNAKATLEALLRRESEFVRTPKLGVSKRGQSWASTGYRAARTLLPTFEVAMGLYYTHAIVYALTERLWLAVPFLCLFQVGFLYTGLMSLLQTPFLARRRATETTAEGAA